MADIMKQFIRHMDGMAKFKIADAAAKAMAEHCDKRIAKAKKAIDREERHIRALVKRRSNGGPTVSQIDSAFERLRAALEPTP